MQFKVEASVLIAALKKVVRISTHSGAITDLVHCTLEGNDLTVVATNMDERITTTLEVEGIKPGSVLLPVQKVVALTQALPNDAQVEFKADPKTRSATMKAGRGRYKLNGLPPDDFPDLNADPSDELTLTLDGPELHRSISTCQYAMPKSDVRQFLNGMLFEVGKSDLRVVATDGHRLAWVQLAATIDKDIAAEEKRQFIVPFNGVRMVLALLSKCGTSVTASFTRHHAVFSVDGTTFLTLLVSGDYPDYRRVIPDGKKHTGRIVVASELLSQAVNRVSALVDKSRSNQGVCISFEKDGIVLESQNSSDESANDFVAADIEAPDFEAIGINIHYLADLASVENELNIQLYGKDDSIYAVTEQGDRGHVLMPMRL